MKKLIILGVLVGLFFQTNTFAGQSDAFNYDRSAIDQEMQGLNLLEDYLTNNPGTTLDQLTGEYAFLAAGIGNTGGLAGMYSFYDKALGIPGFMWGCCLGFTGVLIVALVSKDEHEVKQSIIGGVISVAFWVIAVAGVYVYYIYALGIRY
jgi:hypothetical protein